MLRAWLVVVVCCCACGSRARAHDAAVAPTPPAAPPRPAASGTAPPVAIEPIADAGPAAAEVVGFSCDVEVDAYGSEVEGSVHATGTMAEALEQRAWHDVCAALQKAHGVDCNDEARVSKTRMQSVEIKNGKIASSITFRLKPVLAKLPGSASSVEDWRQACLTAVESACKGAPAGTTCDAKGVWCRATDRHDVHAVCAPPSRRVEGSAPLVEPSGSLFD